MRLFPEPTELLLIGYSIESIWTQKIQIRYIDTKSQFADILTKGNFTRNEWNHLLCLFNISHFSSTNCSEVMSKRTQKHSGEERVAAKSMPMRNFVSRCSERTPDVLASTASQSPEKTRNESQILLSSWTEQHLWTGRLVKDAYSSSYSEWNADKNWSSQEWKSDEFLELRLGRRVNEQPPDLFALHTDRFIVDDDDMDSNTVAESDIVKIQIILAPGEWSSAEDAGPILKRCNSTQQPTFLNMENVDVFDITSIMYSWERITKKIYILWQIQEKISHWNRCLTYLKTW